MSVDSLLLESCRADAIEEVMNDRFEEEYEICEGCGRYVPVGEVYGNEWLGCVCAECREMRPCDGCGRLIPMHVPANGDGEFYCAECIRLLL